MGASGWQYVVAYEPDINKALQTLRQREFKAGRYFKRLEFLSLVIEQGTLTAEQGAQLKPTLDDLRTWPMPRTIAELQEQNVEDGTHSILDIELITDVPDFGTASPLTPEQLLEVFGTPRPSLERVIEKAKAGELAHFRGRWQGLYVIAYANGLPSDIFFCGSTGD
jgi:hypothetical protein